MTIDGLMDLVNRNLGYQAYVTTIMKPFDQPKNPNPFHPQATPDKRWYYQRIEVGITTLFGNQPISFDVTPDLVIEDLKKKVPQKDWQ